MSRAVWCAPLLLLLAGRPVLAQGTPNVARDLNAMLGGQGRLLWVDGTANLTRSVTRDGQTVTIDYTTTIEGVREVVRKARAAHINTLVVDVKPLSGQVLYRSRVAPRMTEWKGHKLPDFDLLAAFVSEGHKAGLQVDASINVLSEGHKYFRVGPGYQHPDWQSVVYTIDRGMYAPSGERLSVRAPGEPDDPSKPVLLGDDSTVLSSGPTSGMVGLDIVDAKASDSVQPAAQVGKQLNVVLDDRNRVVGMVDSALLGDDPLTAPESGRLITVSRESDRAWTAQHLRPGAAVNFDLRTGRTPIADAASERVAVFVSPLHPDARRHELDIVRELVANYDIDGLVLDRCRFSNLNNDYSDQMREGFTRWLGRAINRWPQDVFAFPETPGGRIKQGPLYRPWLEFRARIIRDFVAEIARTARGVKPHITLGSYVGSWYPRYYEVGVNWGSENTRLRYPWFTANYPKTGYAEFFDWISTGCYYPLATADDAREQGASPQSTVEYAASLSNAAVASGSFVYAGVYVQDYQKNPEMFIKAVKAAAGGTQGWMVFDTSQMDEYNFWPYLERAFSDSPQAPHTIPGLLSTVRAAADAAR